MFKKLPNGKENISEAPNQEISNENNKENIYGKRIVKDNQDI